MIKRLIGMTVFQIAFAVFYCWVTLKQRMRKIKDHRRGR